MYPIISCFLALVMFLRQENYRHIKNNLAIEKRKCFIFRHPEGASYETTGNRISSRIQLYSFQ